MQAAGSLLYLLHHSFSPPSHVAPQSCSIPSLHAHGGGGGGEGEGGGVGEADGDGERPGIVAIWSGIVIMSAVGSSQW